MAALRTLLHVEQLDQRILPSSSPITPGIASPPALHVLTTVNPGGPMLPAAAVNPGGPMAQSLPITARAQIDIVQPEPFVSGVTQPAQRIDIYSAQQLDAVTGMTTTELAADLHVASINWNTQMLVLVGEGLDAYGAGTPQVDITALNVANGDLTVQWRLEQPNLTGPIPMFMRLGDPADVVLTTRFTGPVGFHQNPTITLPATSDALAGSGSGSYAVVPLVAAIEPQPGSAAPLHIIVGDIGERYDFTGTADLSRLGNVTVTGSIHGLGNIAIGHATGTLTFSNAHGSVTVDVTGPSQPGFSPLPTQFQYTIASGTGAYANVHDQGTLNLVLKPSAQPSNSTSPATQGTFTLQIP